MTESTKIEVQARETKGKNANRKTRAASKIPAVVYGGGKESVSIELDRKTFIESMRGRGEEKNPLFLLKLGDKERHAMIREIQTNPLSRQVIHIDFQRVLMDQKVRVAVPIELVGVAHGVKVEGGMLDFVNREIHVECLPGDIPKHIEHDVTEMRMGQHLEAKDLALPEGLTLLDEPERVIASLGHGRTDADALVAEERVEPEVIKRTKGEE
jgi:large subunit ribosomal protein L25